MNKIILAFLGIVILKPALAYEFSIGKFECKTGGYAKLDNGKVGTHNINTSFARPSDFEYYEDYSRSDEIHLVGTRAARETYMWAYTPEEKVIWRRSIDNNIFDRGIRNLRFDRETYFQVRDQAAVGLNFVCRI